MIGGMLKCSTLTLTPKNCSKCCKMPKYNFLFLGVTFMVGDMLKCLDKAFHFGYDMLSSDYAENPPPNLKIQIFKYPSEIEIHKFPFEA